MRSRQLEEEDVDDDGPTEQELKWAARIKEAALAMSPERLDADKISDLEYLQHAIIAKDQIDKAMKRLQRLQKVKEEYGIQNDGSYQEGMRDWKAFQVAFPGVSLSLASSPYDGTHVHCLDFARYLARNLKTQESHAVVMRWTFYFLQACNCNIPAMRAGVAFLADTQDGAWSFANYSRSMEERTTHLLENSYPIRLQNIIMLRVNWLVRVFHHLARRAFVSRKMWDKYVLYGGTLQDF